MTTLHLFSRSPLVEVDALDALAWVRSGDVVLLTGGATEALRPSTSAQARLAGLPADVAVHALAEDVQARRLTPDPAVVLIDYLAFVGLTIHSAKVISWT